MYPRGHRGYGALAMLLLLLVSGLAVLPGNTQAQGNQLVGLVYECFDQAKFIEGATVTLRDAHGVLSPVEVVTLADGTFTYSPSPGYYSLTVEKDGYFANETATQIRFDDTATVDVNDLFPDLCLLPTPEADHTLDLLVVSAASVQRSDEAVSFARSQISNENAAQWWIPANQTVRVTRTPVSSRNLVIQFVNGTSSFFLSNGTDYTIAHPAGYTSGFITILNPVVKSNLNNTGNTESLLVTYFTWTNSSRLQYYPVEEGTFSAKKNAAAWPSYGNWSLAPDTGVLGVSSNFTEGWDVLKFSYRSVTALSGATVEAYNASAEQVVRTATTNAQGVASLTLWSGDVELRTSKAGYAANVTTLSVSADGKSRVRMEGGSVITGHARDPAGRFLTPGLVGFLYNTAAGASLGSKVIQAEVVGSLYTFHAPPGTYRMIIDANGYQANASTVTLGLGESRLLPVRLALSDRETYRTTVLYGTADWSNLTIHRNLTLNGDSVLPGLEPTNLRDLRLQIDYALGTTRDGLVDPGEEAAFRAWLEANGPLYVTTDGFLTTNGKAYRSAVSYAVSVNLSAPGGKVWVNTTATYSLKETPYIPVGATRYFVNVTAAGDVNVSVHQDRIFEIALPKTYEMSKWTIFGGLTTDGYTRITLDPDASGTSAQIRMTVEQSKNGTARAKVAGPVGKFRVENASFDNYRAFVANSTNLTFSAEDSTDPVGDIANGNFTWKFLANTTGANDPQNIRYGIRPYFTYTAAGEYVVNLTVREAGGNLTYRDIIVFVDDQAPVAKIRTNKTGSGAVNGTTLRMNEDSPVRFDGGLSTDLAYPGKNSVIPDTGYSWDFDGDRTADAVGRLVNWTFEKPGSFTVNMTVTDGVGWSSVNASLTAIVNDTTPPAPAFDIRDPSKEWGIADSLTENREYSLNASRTTDNYNKASELNYTWTIPGPVLGRTGRNHTFYGMNITFTWTEFNSSYKVVLSVRDAGFGPVPANTANTTRSVTVQVDPALRPDLRIVSGTYSVTPTDPEDGGQVTVTVNVTNKNGRGIAQSVRARVYSVGSEGTKLLSESPTWYGAGDVVLTDRTIAAGQTVKLVFTVTVTGQGNKSIEVRVDDANEAWTQVTPENRAAAQVLVRQAGWVNLAVAGAIVGIIVAFVFAMYVRRKIRAGEWHPRLRRGEKAEAKPKKEPKEEKKRL